MCQLCSILEITRFLDNFIQIPAGNPYGTDRYALSSTSLNPHSANQGSAICTPKKNAATRLGRRVSAMGAASTLLFEGAVDNREDGEPATFSDDVDQAYLKAVGGLCPVQETKL